MLKHVSEITIHKEIFHPTPCLELVLHNVCFYFEHVAFGHLSCLPLSVILCQTRCFHRQYFHLQLYIVKIMKCLLTNRNNRTLLLPQEYIFNFMRYKNKQIISDSILNNVFVPWCDSSQEVDQQVVTRDHVFVQSSCS